MLKTTEAGMNQVAFQQAVSFQVKKKTIIKNLNPLSFKV